MVGFVYIMSSPLFSRIKIGKSTKDPSKDRLSELNQETGNPEKFKCEYYALVGNENTLERAIHKRFASRRPNPKREFFDVSILEAMESIRDLSQDHGGLKHEEISFREVKKINYDDGSIYEGETLNDKHNGQGILKHKIYLDLSDRKFLSKSFFVGDNWKEIPRNKYYVECFRAGSWLNETNSNLKNHKTFHLFCEQILPILIFHLIVIKNPLKQ